MILYLDTSLIVAALTAEAETRRVQAWLGARQSDDLMISDWVMTEFSAALSMKLRRRDIDDRQRTQALATYARMCSDSLTTLPVSREQFHVAGRFSDRSATGLRGGDALHLAIAAAYGATVCTLDRRLSEAGPPLSVPTLLV